MAAASVTAVAQVFANISEGPTGAFVAESVVDVLLPVAFLGAVIQRGLLARNLAGLGAPVTGGADIRGVRHALRETLRDPTLEVLPGAATPSPAPTAGRRGDPDERGTPIAVVTADAAPWPGTGACSTQRCAPAAGPAQRPALTKWRPPGPNWIASTHRVPGL